MTEQASSGPVDYRTIDISNVPDCRAREVLDLVADKWSLSVLSTLEAGPRRFTELKRSITGISQRMLTVTLRDLQRDGILTRTVYAVMPPNVSYELTAMGRTLQEATHPLIRWSIAHVDAIDGARAEFDNQAETAR
ncbi:winged helix-turn-helix transcriptional regulator [Kribbella qitaiheensis]|uniref:winged helix-turn-helix transcriptional regulator n=1 Tax=Kribbella qitaiheensis TaxID=1544730 RepID=UPI003620DE92